jgi:GNAT superfamily N-acetyltransferase
MLEDFLFGGLIGLYHEAQLVNRPELTRRQATDADYELIYKILRASLGPYVEQTFGSWDEETQRRRFEEVTRVEDQQILELRGETAGCLCLKESAEELRLARLFILPQFQNRGSGTRIMEEIVELSDRKKLPVRLRVLRVNPARRLYDRSGFQVIEEDATHFTMLRKPRIP